MCLNHKLVLDNINIQLLMKELGESAEEEGPL